MYHACSKFQKRLDFRKVLRKVLLTLTFEMVWLRKMWKRFCWSGWMLTEVTIFMSWIPASVTTFRWRRFLKMTHFSFVLGFIFLMFQFWFRMNLSCIWFFVLSDLREAESLAETRLAVVLSEKTDGDFYLTPSLECNRYFMLVSISAF